TLFSKDAICEDVDAVFFDANNDGHPDLYVVSGGNESREPQELEDRLYVNDGTGHFTKASEAFTPEYKNKSCVAVADVDLDGDADVFVGTLSNPAAYGIPQTSCLFINDGHAHFTKATSRKIKLDSIGMVTSAAFADVNNDGWPDLVVSGEWMPIKIYINNKGTFEEKDLPASTGLWQNVYVTDLNGDGYPDFFAGNWGHNTKLWAGKNGPCKLFVKDFDRNGSIDQVMSYSIDGKDYSFLAKDELERSLPVLKKAYLNYGEVAGKTVQYMLYDLFKGNIELEAVELGSCYFENDKKGGFKKIILPDRLQLAPIFTFQKTDPQLQDKMFISGGNFFDVTPYEGRYDAQSLALFRSDNYGLHELSQPDLSQVPGQVRDMKWIRTVHGRVLVVARNNQPLIFLKRGM
ncbi:MAG: FG-GAP repeat domain-containing protein, partial [Flavisolibacter sp.]